MHTPLVRWSRNLYLAGIVLALVLVIPAAWFPFQLGKVAIFSLLLVPAIVLLSAGGGVREMLRAHGAKAALVVVLLPLVYLLSALRSGSALSITGNTLEVDTVLFVTLGAVAFLLAFTFFRTLRTVRQLLSVLRWAILAAALFQIAMIVTGGSIVPLPGFNDASTNLVGKWNDFGLLTGLLLLVVLAELELAALSPAKKLLYLAAAGASLFILTFVNFGLVWTLILGGSLVLALIKFLSRRAERESYSKENLLAPGAIPWYAASATAVSLTFLFFGATFNAWATSAFPVSSIEVRPSIRSTYDIAKAAHGDSPAHLLLGTGPNTFSEAWIAFKPAEVNQSAFWNIDFNVGFSTLLTAFSTVGVAGVLLWLLPSVLVAAAAVRVLRLGVLSREERAAAAGIVFASLFLTLGLALYVPSANVALLSFVLSGAAFGFLWRQGRSVPPDYAPTRLTSLAAGLVGFMLVAVVVAGAFMTGRRALAYSFIQQGLQALSQQDAERARILAARSLKVETTGEALRLLTDAGNLHIQQLAQTEPAPQDVATVQQQFAAVVQETIQAGQLAVQFNAKDYRPYLSVGRVYEVLSALNVEGAYESAKASYQGAAERNPTSPAIPLILARLESSRGNFARAQEEAGRSLTLKPNYTDAILFVVQLNVANNDIPKAIEAAAAAARTAPGVAPIWFQLGLLYYASGDTANAALALEQAVRLVPEYANAKYFLGLSYHALKREQDAIRMFEDLARTNPDNAEVALILGNLRTGRPPFEGAPPPATPPEDRAQAPISE